MAKTAAQNIKELDKKVRAAVLKGLLHASDDIQSSGRDVTQRWYHKVDFTDSVARPQQRIEVTIKPKGKRENLAIWGYVEHGTKPHKIPKVVVPGKLLKFRTGYSAKTMAVAKYNVGTGQSFGSWRSAKQVNHPGSKGRKFLVSFLKELSPRLEVRVNQEVARVI
jgi:hypothetical protein